PAFASCSGTGRMRPEASTSSACLGSRRARYCATSSSLMRKRNLKSRRATRRAKKFHLFKAPGRRKRCFQTAHAFSSKCLGGSPQGNCESQSLFLRFAGKPAPVFIDLHRAFAMGTQLEGPRPPRRGLSGVRQQRKEERSHVNHPPQVPSARHWRSRSDGAQSLQSFPRVCRPRGGKAVHRRQEGRKSGVVDLALRSECGGGGTKRVYREVSRNRGRVHSSNCAGHLPAAGSEP